MKKIQLFTVLFFISVFIFSSCSKDNQPNNSTPITNLSLPSSSPANPIMPGDTITIGGEGFTSTSQIWFRSSGTNATDTTSSNNAEGTVIKVSTTGISVVVPAVQGSQSLILEEVGVNYTLGTLIFYTPKKKLLIKIGDGTLSYDSHNRLIKISNCIFGTDTINTTYTYDTNGKIIAFGTNNSISYKNDSTIIISSTSGGTTSSDSLILNSRGLLIRKFSNSSVDVKQDSQNWYASYFDYSKNGDLTQSTHITRTVVGVSDIMHSYEVAGITRSVFTYDDKVGCTAYCGLPNWLCTYYFNNDMYPTGSCFSLGQANNVSSTTDYGSVDYEPEIAGFTLNVNHSYDSDGYPTSCTFERGYGEQTEMLEYKTIN